MERTVSLNWLSSRNGDLFWYIGSVATAWLMIYLHVGLGISALVLYWVWILWFDGPHLFATIVRTYLDRQERVERRGLLLGSLFWFLPAPLLVAGGLITGSKLPFVLFLVFAQLWAYWHVVRQHYGFLNMYQRKNGEPAGKDNLPDYYLFYGLMIAPFISFALRHPEARHQLGLPASLSSLETTVLTILHAGIAAAVLAYIGKELWGWWVRGRVNLAKSVFLAACVPLHLALFLHPRWSVEIDILLFALIVTVYHNVQYVGIVWFYNRNRYSSDADGARYGMASRVGGRLVVFYLVGAGLAVLMRNTGWSLTGQLWPFQGHGLLEDFKLGGMFSTRELVGAFWWAVAMHHYYLDQKIWRVSRDRRLNVDLKLAAEGA